MNKFDQEILDEFDKTFCYGIASPETHEMVYHVEPLADLKDIKKYLLSVIQRTREETTKIDFDIDVRYEADVIKAFNKFIQKWCGSNAPHLLDSDEQDGQFMREKIEDLLSSLKSK